MKKTISLLALGAVLVFTGCGGAKPPLYHWGDYESSATEYGKNGHEKGVLEEHLQALKKIIDESTMKKQRVAPGIYAEYAQVLYTSNRKDDAKQYFLLEKQTYPESQHFIDTVMKKLYGEAQ